MRHRACCARYPLPAVTIGLLLLFPSHVAAQSARSPASLHLANPVILTLMPIPQAAPTPAEIVERAAASRRIEGTFFGEYTNSTEPGAVFRGVLRLTQGGSAVSGTFVTNTGRTAELSGRVEGDRLEATLAFNDGCAGSTRLTSRVSHGGRRLSGSYRANDCHGAYFGDVVLRTRDAAPAAIQHSPSGLAGPGDPTSAPQSYSDLMVAVKAPASIRASLESAVAAQESENLRIYPAPHLPAAPAMTEDPLLGAVRFSAAKSLLILTAEEIQLDEALGEGASTVVFAVLYDARSGDAVWSGSRAYVAEARGEGTAVETDAAGTLVRAVDSLFQLLYDDGALSR